jgi:hypothetical protein
MLRSNWFHTAIAVVAATTAAITSGSVNPDDWPALLAIAVTAAAGFAARSDG